MPKKKTVLGPKSVKYHLKDEHKLILEIFVMTYLILLLFVNIRNTSRHLDISKTFQYYDCQAKVIACIFNQMKNLLTI